MQLRAQFSPFQANMRRPIATPLLCGPTFNSLKDPSSPPLELMDLGDDEDEGTMVVE